MRTALPSLLIWLLLPGVLFAQGTIGYAPDVKPLLQKKCHACHGTLWQKSGLRLDVGRLILEGGEGGRVVVPGKSSASELIRRITSKEAGDRMPPEDEGEPLTPAEIALLKSWIDQGAKVPANENIPPSPFDYWSYQQPKRPAVPVGKNTGWERNPVDAFIAAQHEQRGLQPSPPSDKSALLRRVYLDLIGVPPTREELHACLADPSDQAYEKTVDRLLDDSRHGQRWARHWMDVWRYSDWHGRRKLNNHRNSQRHIWRWRDWIVDSINEDKPYDRMILEMLAGDEIAGDDPDIVRATGYLGRSWYIFNKTVWMQDTVEHLGQAFLGVKFECCRCHDHKYDPVSQREYYRLRAFFEPLDFRVDRVPDHTATFRDPEGGGSGKEGEVLQIGLSRAYDATHQAPTYLFQRGNEFHPVKDSPLEPGVPKSLGGVPLQIEEVQLPLMAYYPSLRPFIEQETLAALKTTVANAEVELAKAQKEWNTSNQAQSISNQKDTPSGITGDSVSASDAKLADAERKLKTARLALQASQARFAADRAKYQHADVADAKLAQRAAQAECELAVAVAQDKLHQIQRDVLAAQTVGESQDEKSKKPLADLQKKLELAENHLASARAKLQEGGGNYALVGKIFPATSTGRRSALANWLVSRQNPRTARVAVNQMWLRHFGEALAHTVNDFGMSGDEPSHPKLLDWLAVEFMDQGWSMKTLHRIMVTSNTYRMQSNIPETAHPNVVRDSTNRYLWRFPSRRVEAEVVRDSLLHVAGVLDITPNGPEIDPKLAQTSHRRSLYFMHTPDSRAEFLDLFDSGNPEECYRRRETIVPNQALAMAHSELSIVQSRRLARRISAILNRTHKESHGKQSTDTEFVTIAFEQILTRRPLPAEQTACETFLLQQAEFFRQNKELTAFREVPAGKLGPAKDSVLRARENLVHVMFNHNDFVTIR